MPSSCWLHAQRRCRWSRSRNHRTRHTRSSWRTWSTGHGTGAAVGTARCRPSSMTWTSARSMSSPSIVGTVMMTSVIHPYPKESAGDRGDTWAAGPPARRGSGADTPGSGPGYARRRISPSPPRSHAGHGGGHRVCPSGRKETMSLRRIAGVSAGVLALAAGVAMAPTTASAAVPGLVRVGCHERVQLGRQGRDGRLSGGQAGGRRRCRAQRGRRPGHHRRGRARTPA